MSNIYLNRDEASQVLNVSTRTLDRYIRRYKFKIRKEGRKVLIRRADVDHIINDHIGHFLKDFDAMRGESGQGGQAVQNVQNVQNLAVKDIKVESVKIKEDGVYKELYLEVKQELKEKQDRLEAATYRVGQLESQIKHMVPLLDYTRKDKELKAAKEAIDHKVAEHEVILVKMNNRICSERVAKWVYLSLVGLLLIAEPILFVMWAFS